MPCRRPWPPRWTIAAATAATLLLGACAAPPPQADGRAAAAPVVAMPLQIAWFEGRRVFYVTTDVSDAAVALDKGANFVPRLADLVAERASPGLRGVPVERVYAFAPGTQPNVFPSVPLPVGAASTSRAYSPLWRMVKVAWQPGHTPRELRSEEQILDAEERGEVTLTVTDVILNCPVVGVEGDALLRGVSLPGS